MTASQANASQDAPLGVAVGRRPLDAFAERAPKSVLLFERVHYEWLHPRFIKYLQDEFGTKFTILTPRNAVAERRKTILNGEGEIVFIEDVDAAAAKRNGAEDEERAIAGWNERHYDVAYLRDLVQQERWMSTFFVGHAPNSFAAEFVPPPLSEIVCRINYYFEFAAGLFDERKFDCVIGWPSYNLFTAVATHVALKRQIPFSFLVPGRRDFRLMWSDGPYVSPRFLRSVMDSYADDEIASVVVPKRKPPSDTLEAIEQLPNELKISTYLKRLVHLTRDHIVWRLRDLRSGSKIERRSYLKHARRLINDWLLYRYVSRHSVKDMAALQAVPFIFFPLPYEPEYPNTSLAREFNDTLAFVKQTALAAPAGYRVVVKEHVVGVGHRRKSLYQDLLRFPNVVLADNTLRGIDLVERCAAVATINGTAGLEAAYAGRRAVLFSPNVEYSAMRHVQVVERMKDLPSIFRKAVAPVSDLEQEAFSADVRRHFRAIEDLCVDVSKVTVFGGTQAELPDAEYIKLFKRFLQTYAFLSTGQRAVG